MVNTRKTIRPSFPRLPCQRKRAIRLKRYFSIGRKRASPQTLSEDFLNRLRSTSPEKLPPDDFSYSELLDILPGPFQKPFPISYKDHRVWLPNNALTVLVKKLAKDFKEKKLPNEIERKLRASVRFMVEETEKKDPDGLTPLEIKNFGLAMELTGYLQTLPLLQKLMNFLTHKEDGIIYFVTKALSQKKRANVLARIKELVREALAHPETPGKFRDDWTSLLKAQMGDHLNRVASFYEKIIQEPLDIAQIQQFRLSKQEVLNGSGIRGVILDHGFEKDHPDLEGRLKVDPFSFEETDHGTASASVWMGRLSGIAKGVCLEGQYSKAPFLAPIAQLNHWIRFLQEAVSQAKSGQNFPRIFSLSLALGGFILVYKDSPKYQQSEKKWFETCKEAYQQGILILIAAGNDQRFFNKEKFPFWDEKRGQLESILCSPFVLRIGAAQPLDQKYQRWGPAPYSSYGGKEFKPSFCAPTNQIAACSGNYDLFGGTSCATPFTAGVVSLMLQANPDLSSEQVFQILLKTCMPMEGEIAQIGQGLINPKGAIYESLLLRDTKEARRFQVHMEKT